MLTDQPADTQPSVATLSETLGSLLEKSGLSVTTAESCTGGLLAGAITDVAGSSAWFGRGVVTYSNAAKQDLLGVDDDILQQHGAVSEACVKAMAEGALQHSGADVAISVSGIAGPGGATPGKPVGTVWIGWALRSASGSEDSQSDTSITPYNVVDAAVFLFSGDRLQVRNQAVHQALRGTISRMDNIGT